ncbi:MAG: 4-hydroxy-2-oxovalerate aldolase [Clostridia bacterium]|nr:4-hydroxy-2-oxovalerate aldolase [Clostridia bacterium]
MKLFDCTLRDGANVVGNGFSRELTLSMLKGLIGSGITEIELGNAKGLGAAEAMAADAPLSDAEYMELAAPFQSKANIGMFVLAPLASPERVALAKDKGLAFLRVGAAAGDGAKSVGAVQAVKAAGLVCRYSMMKGYLLSAEELAEEAALLERSGVDCITIMDSAGTMFPDEVGRYVRAMKEKVKIPVGFHGHSNLGLSQANALAAVAAGAEEIDCGLLGMARSAGNCATELAAVTLQKEGYLPEVDAYGLLSYLDNELIPLMREWDYRPAVMPVDLVLGYSGCHSSFLGQLRQVAEAKDVNLYKLIVEVSRIDRKAPSVELMERTAASLR